MQTASFREEIYSVFTDPDRTVEEQICHALALGVKCLAVEIGFLTRISDGTQRIVESTGGVESVEAGTTCPLEDAYCRRTVETDGTLAVEDAGAASEITDRAVRTFGLGSYIGARVVVGGETYGTVCFADEDVRDGSFSETERMFVELVARLVGQSIERREYERELRERNARLEREKQRFEGIAETSFDILFRLNMATEFSYVSSAVTRVLAFEPDELVGSPFTDFLTGESVDRALGAFEMVLEREPVEDLELEFVHADGGTVTLAVNGTAIVEDDRIVGAQGVGRDITARKAREEELRVKNRAIEEAEVGISIADASVPGVPLRYVNRRFEHLTGYDASRVLGRNCSFLQGPMTDPRAVDRFREAIEAATPASVEILNYRSDGSPFWNQVRISPIKDETGEVTHYLGFQEDITERRRSQQLIELLNRVLRHNLRNDMNVILGYAEMLPDGGGDGDGGGGGDRVAAYRDQIVSTASELIGVSERAQELEGYTHQEREPRRLDPETVLCDVAADARRDYQTAEIDVTVETDREICAGRELRTAVAELVENALKHNRDGGPTAELTATDEGEWIELTVRDTGGGVDEMEAAVISSGRETALEHGSGLGIWLVNWIVTRYGGSFQVRAVDLGTEATMKVPAIDPDTSVEEVARRPTVLFR